MYDVQNFFSLIVFLFSHDRTTRRTAGRSYAKDTKAISCETAPLSNVAYNSV